MDFGAVPWSPLPPVTCGHWASSSAQFQHSPCRRETRLPPHMASSRARTSSPCGEVRHERPPLRQVPAPQRAHRWSSASSPGSAAAPTRRRLSLDDQVDHGKQVVAELYDGPVEYRVIATKGKGERLDRPELAEIEAMLRTGELDVLVAEDIGRMRPRHRGGPALRHRRRPRHPRPRPQRLHRHRRGHLGGGRHLGLPRPRRPQRPHLQAAQAEADEPLPEVRRRHALRDLRLRQARRGQDLRRLAEGRGGQPSLRGVVPHAARDAQLLGRGRLAQRAAACRSGQYCRAQDLGRGDGPADHRATRCSRGCPAAGSSTPSSTTRPAAGSRSRTPTGRRSCDCPHLAYVDPAEFDERQRPGSTRPTRAAAASRSTGSTPARGCRGSGPGSRASTPAAGTAAGSYVWGGNGMAGNLMCNGSRSGGAGTRSGSPARRRPAGRRRDRRRAGPARRVRRPVPRAGRAGRPGRRRTWTRAAGRAAAGRRGAWPGSERTLLDGHRRVRPQADVPGEARGAGGERRGARPRRRRELERLREPGAASCPARRPSSGGCSRRSSGAWPATRRSSATCCGRSCPSSTSTWCGSATAATSLPRARVTLRPGRAWSPTPKHAPGVASLARRGR